MNEKLVNYGYHNEKSDIRIHVCVVAQWIVVYLTKKLQEFMSNNKNKYRYVPAYQSGIKSETAWGYLVPPDHIPDTRQIYYPEYSWDRFPSKFADTSLKGKSAVDVVLKLMEQGRLPIWAVAQEVQNKSCQISGADIIMPGGRIIQVKCDYDGGKKQWHRKCTGNLFIQDKEWNPFKKTDQPSQKVIEKEMNRIKESGYELIDIAKSKDDGYIQPSLF